MMAENKYHLVTSIEAALSLAKQHVQSFKYIAGGTDVLVNRFQGNDESASLIDLSGIAILKEVHADTHFLKIGSLIRLDDLKKHEIIKEQFPALLKAANEVASPILRKTATLGGNILCENRCTYFNQSAWWRESVGYCLKCDGEVCIATGGTKACFSKFVSDTAPVLISMNAQLEIIDEKSLKIIPLESIYTGDGINPRNLSKTAIIKNIMLPLDNSFKVVFKKLRPREAVDFTSLTTAVSLVQNGKIKIVIGGIDPKPVIVEGMLDVSETLIQDAVKKARIVDNDYYSRAYRKEMMILYLKQSLEELNNK
ncbi:MAG: FAD binding domain-containing protein [Bacteroidota bacterium]|nr:FAD binding domain-containing protein [Bacteroidota bacterium]